MKRIRGLDTLRAFAVLCVIKVHWGPYYDNSHPVRLFLQSFFIDAASGIYLFFVLSGFLITSILLDAKEKDNSISDKLFTVKNFFVRRALRIFPIYYILIFLVYTQYADIRENIVYFLTYTSNILCYRTNSWNSASHTWTLAIEEQFYIVWPWIILFTSRKYLKYVFIASILIGSISTYFTLKTSIQHFLPFNCIDAFGIGGFYAYARLDSTSCKRFEKVIKRVAPWLLILYFYWKSAPYTHTDYGIFLNKTVSSVIFVWLIILVINNKSERVRKYLLENRFLNFIGVISYGIYLFHPYIPHMNPYIVAFVNDRIIYHQRIHDFLISHLFLYILDLTVLVLVCWFSYTAIEKPILSLKNRFTYSHKST